MFPAIIDNSMRSAFVACPERFRRAYIQNLVPATPSVHLHAGGCFAAGLHATRQAFYTQGLTPAESLCIGASEILRLWGPPTDFADTDKSLARILLAFDDYFAQYPLGEDPIRPHVANGKATTEFSFAFPLEIDHPETGEPLLYAGRADMIGTFQNTFWIVDEKTTLQLGPSWGQQWDLKSQFTGYCAAARAFGLPVAGAIIRGIGLLRTKTTFQQVILYRPDWVIERWWRQLHRDLERAIALYRELGPNQPWDQALDEPCAAFGGCSFRRLCNALEPSAWIDGYYTTRQWDPLKPL